MKGFKFAPLVNKKLELVSELDILFLRPEEPGQIVSGGDIDNCLKTLFDALRCPSNKHEIPNNEDLSRTEPTEQSNQFYHRLSFNRCPFT